jgi:hypothetical protein
MSLVSTPLGNRAAEQAGDNGTNPEQRPARTIVFHYHLFKNAGTSVDELLRQNFGAAWATQEFHGPRRNNAASVLEFLRANTHLNAASSHTAHLPVPRIDGIEIFPIIFIRHPLDRLRSAYEFERRQIANTPGARLAKAHDFAGYLRVLLKNKHHRQVRNFQTFRLAQNETPRAGSERERALHALSKLPFVGSVEHFHSSLHRLERLLRPIFPHFRAARPHRNISQRREMDLSQRLNSIETCLGAELYADLLSANEDDMAVYAAMQDLANSRDIQSVRESTSP